LQLMENFELSEVRRSVPSDSIVYGALYWTEDDFIDLWYLYSLNF
jgi:hypothetical protein